MPSPANGNDKMPPEMASTGEGEEGEGGGEVEEAGGGGAGGGGSGGGGGESGGRVLERVSETSCWNVMNRENCRLSLSYQLCSVLEAVPSLITLNRLPRALGGGSVNNDTLLLLLLRDRPFQRFDQLREKCDRQDGGAGPRSPSSRRSRCIVKFDFGGPRDYCN